MKRNLKIVVITAEQRSSKLLSDYFAERGFKPLVIERDKIIPEQQLVFRVLRLELRHQYMFQLMQSGFLFLRIVLRIGCGKLRAGLSQPGVQPLTKLRRPPANLDGRLLDNERVRVLKVTERHGDIMRPLRPPPGAGKGGAWRQARRR